MINEIYKNMLQGKSVIRELSEYATARGKEIGYENVFDYSLGNPSVPCADAYTKAMIHLHEHHNPIYLHGYSPSVGIHSVKQDVADSLNRRFHMNYSPEHIFMTSGATGALAHALRVVTKPGDEVIVFAPFFPEYYQYVGGTGAKIKVIPASVQDFQIRFDILEEQLTEKVSAVLINTPNNPSGVVYSHDTLVKLADLLRTKQEEYGHDIFLISDEPYREILFGGKEIDFVSKLYDNSLCCYSFSKSLSLPGERIGYIAVNPNCTDAELMSAMFSQISRLIGHNCPSSSIQYAVAQVIDKVSDLSIYETNMKLLYEALIDLGFEVVKPDGTFYIFPKTLEEDATSFCKKAMKYDLIFVPSDGFQCPGHFRMAYCVDTEKVKRSIPVLERFVREEYGR